VRFAAGSAAERPVARGVVAEVIQMTRMSLVWLIDQVQRRLEEIVPCEAWELLVAGRRDR
jgi:hypothetical protein